MTLKNMWEMQCSFLGGLWPEETCDSNKKQRSPTYRHRVGTNIFFMALFTSSKNLEIT